MEIYYNQDLQKESLLRENVKGSNFSWHIVLQLMRSNDTKNHQKYFLDEMHLYI